MSAPAPLPQYLPRALHILAQLARRKVDDNWNNKPENSMNSIFLYEFPQTTAPIDQRIRALEDLVKKHPDIAWGIYNDQFGAGTEFRSSNQRPAWRSDASGAGYRVPTEEQSLFARRALDLSIAWARHDERTLGDLIQRLDGLLEED